MYASQAVLLVIAAASGYTQDPCVPDCRHPLPRNVENIRYELHVQPYFPADGVELDPVKKFTFDGFVRIHYRVTSFAQNVSLDHLNLTLQNLALYRNEAAVDVEHVIDNETGRLVILPGEYFVPKLDYTIEVSYMGLVNAAAEGVAYSTNAKGGWSVLISTQFEPRDARRLLPCFDDPHFKAVFELTLTYPKGYTALSNTRSRKTFATRMEYLTRKISDAKVRVWGWDEMGGSLAFAANISVKCVSAMQNYTGIPYALDKLGKQWQVLHESFARFFQSYLFMDYEAPGRQQFASASLSNGINQGLDDAEHSLHPLVYTTDDRENHALPDHVYDAGAAILSTVEAVFGKDAFRDALRIYLRAHEFGNARYRDLIAALQTENAHVDLGRCAGVVNLTAFLDSWFLQPDLPLIDVKAFPNGNGYSVVQEPLIRRSALPSGYEYSWIIPLRDGGKGERLWVLPGDKLCREGNLTEALDIPIRDRFSPFARIRYDNASFEAVFDVLFRDARHRDDDSVFFRLIEDELYFVANNRSYDAERAIRIAIERLMLAGRDGRISSSMFETAMTLLNDRRGLRTVRADRWEKATKDLLTPIYSAIGWNRVDVENWDKRALQDLRLLYAVSYHIDDALSKAQNFAQEFVAECGGTKNFSSCVTLNVDILPVAICGALKSKNASVVKLVDAYEAFLSQDPVQKYIGNAEIVGKARGCAHRNVE